MVIYWIDLDNFGIKVMNLNRFNNFFKKNYFLCNYIIAKIVDCSKIIK